MTKRESKSCLILVVFGCLAAHQAVAAPVYSTYVRNHVNGAVVFTGGTSVSGTIFYGGGGTGGGTATVGIAPASTTSMLMTTFVNAGAGTSPDVDLGAMAVFSDVIFTDVNNPGNNGNIQVSANYLVTLTGTTNHTQLDYSIGFDVFGTLVNATFINAVPSGTLTSNVVTVPLNSPLTLNLFGQQRLANPAPSGVGSGSLALALNPFNLPAGFTVNSVDAGIVNNVIPEPSTFALAVLGLLGLGRRGRRRQQA